MAFPRVHPQATMNDLILAHLRKEGNISGMEAIGLFKCRHLPRRIKDLRERGHSIHSVTRQDTTGQRYVRYVLADEVAENRRLPHWALPSDNHIPAERTFA